MMNSSVADWISVPLTYDGNTVSINSIDDSVANIIKG